MARMKELFWKSNNRNLNIGSKINFLGMKGAGASVLLTIFPTRTDKILKLKYLRYFALFLRFSSFCGFFPIVFNNESTNFQLRKGTYWLWILHVLHNYFRICFLVIQLRRFGTRPDVDPMLKVRMSMWLVFNCLVAVLNTNMIFKKGEIIVYLNKFYLLNGYGLRTKFRGHLTKKLKEALNTNKFIRYVMMGYVGTAAFLITLPLFIYIMRPKSPQYIAFWVLNLWDNLFMRIVLTFMEAAFMACSWALMLFHVFLSMSHQKAMTYWLSELITDLEKPDIQMKDYTKVIVKYGSYNIIMLLCMQAFSPIAWVGHRLVLLPTTITCSFFMLKYSHMATEKPQIFIVYVISFLGSMTFQVIFSKLCGDVFDRAGRMQSLIIHRYWGYPYLSRLNIKTALDFRRLPKYAGAFKINKQSRPLQFIRKVMFIVAKINIYLN